MKNSKKGISLIVLIITIVVIVILAIAVIFSMQDNNPISNANEAVFINDVASFKEELQMYIAKQITKSRGSFKVANLNATETSLEFNNTSQDGDIYTIIPSLKNKDDYKSIFEVSEGKLVYISEDTNLEELANKAGIERKVNKFKFTINTAVYNATDKTFFVPFTPSSSRSYDFTIEWGDGSDTTIASIEAVNELNCTHSYSKPGLYTVSISSPNDKMPEFNFTKNYPAAEYEAPIFMGYKEDRILEKNNLENYFSYSNNNISLDIDKQPIQEEDSYMNEKNFIPEIKEILESHNSKNEDKLISINSSMLNTETTDFSEVFSGCYNLKKVAGSIFSNNTIITNFYGCFYECENLELISAEMFSKNTLAKNFSWCFYNCSSLTEIPSGLFNNNTVVERFDFCFFYCTSLIEIPSGLFDKNTEVIDFGACFGTCFNLEKIPSGLFDKNINAKLFSGCFESCRALTEIPSGLFDNNIKATSFSGCFGSCELITSIPSGLFNNNILATSFRGCFSGCYDLTSIPNGLFDNNTLADDFYCCFLGCESITEIPNGLFNNNTEAINFDGCFYECRNLISIPNGLFDKTEKVITFERCFSGCYALTSIPSGLFDKNIKVTTFKQCFSACYNLVTIPSGLFNNNLEAISFSGCFSGCYKTQLNKDIFSPITNYATRFAGKNVNFSRCFSGDQFGTRLPRGEAPELWLYNYGSKVSTSCYEYNNATSISNYNSIPAEWK